MVQQRRFEFLDETSRMTHDISVIIPTVGRPEMLRRCLESLTKQTAPVSEVLLVHCGDDAETRELAEDSVWGFAVRYFHHPEKNCALQRNFAIARARFDNLLLIDDDIEVDPQWVEELFKPIWSDPSVGATMGRLVNQPMAQPTFFWRIYRVLLHGRDKGFAAGKLIGAALPNGFPTTVTTPLASEWIGGGVSALRREAFESVGGFASFFTGSSPGEDLDLGYRLSRSWQVLYVPAATCVHHQSQRGRESLDQHQYLSIRARFGILTLTMGKSRVAALGHVGLWSAVQCLSEIASLRRGLMRPDLLRAWSGRLRGFLSCVYFQPRIFANERRSDQR